MAETDAPDPVLVSLDALFAPAPDAPLGSVLRQRTNLTRGLVNARSCALGVLDGDTLADFIVSGISQEERAAIGTPPQGQGSFGVPIRIGDAVFGNLHLTEKVGTSSFSLADQRLVKRLAQYAAVAIANASRLSDAGKLLQKLPVPITIRDPPCRRLLLRNDRARQLFGNIVPSIWGWRRSQRPSAPAILTDNHPRDSSYDFYREEFGRPFSMPKCAAPRGVRR